MPFSPLSSKIMPLSRANIHTVKSDRDGCGIKGMKYKRMDRWMSECNGGRRVRKHSDCKRIKYVKIYVDLMVHLECV